MNKKENIAVAVAVIGGAYALYTAYKQASTLTAQQKMRNTLIGASIIGLAAGYMVRASYRPKALATA